MDQHNEKSTQFLASSVWCPLDFRIPTTHCHIIIDRNGEENFFRFCFLNFFFFDRLTAVSEKMLARLLILSCAVLSVLGGTSYCYAAKYKFYAPCVGFVSVAYETPKPVNYMYMDVYKVQGAKTDYFNYFVRAGDTNCKDSTLYQSIEEQTHGNITKGIFAAFTPECGYDYPPVAYANLYMCMVDEHVSTNCAVKHNVMWGDAPKYLCDGPTQIGKMNAMHLPSC